MKIGIIGAGNIGGVLGQKWAAAGHTIHFGVRHPQDEKFAPLYNAGQVMSVAQALEMSDVILLALPGAAMADFAAGYGAALNGKIVIDATNNLRSPEMHNLAVLAKHAPEAQLGRAFNSLGWENFAKPRLGGVQIDLFFCAQPGARKVAETLISDVGLCPIFVGDIDVAAALDGMTRLWFALALGQQHGRRIAFKLLEE